MLERALEIDPELVIALLEDFRPLRMRARPSTRRDTYIHGYAFDYILQRLGSDLYTSSGDGPHFVAIDHHNEFDLFAGRYREAYRDGWTFNNRRLPRLCERGFSASLLEARSGPVHEIADLVASSVTRWADVRCATAKGGKNDELAELDRCAGALINLFPTSSGIPPRRRGYSIVTHTARRTGKELLRDNVDAWAAELTGPAEAIGRPVASPSDDEIPF